MYRNLVVGCTVAVGIGLLPLPYAYYVLLRLAFFVALLVLGYAVYVKSQTLTLPLIAIGGLAVLYNPLFLVHLGSKAIWLVANIGTLIFMYWAAGHCTNQPGKN